MRVGNLLDIKKKWCDKTVDMKEFTSDVARTIKLIASPLTYYTTEKFSRHMGENIIPDTRMVMNKGSNPFDSIYNFYCFQSVEGEKRQKTAKDLWNQLLMHNKIKIHPKVCYYPYLKKKPTTEEFNIFVPFYLTRSKFKKHIKKDFDFSKTIIWKHLNEVISNSNPKVFEKLLGFVAHIIQKPHKKPNITLVIAGSQGDGKSVFAEEFIKNLLGEEYMNVGVGAGDLFRKFNVDDEKILMKFIEELQDGGDAVKQKDKLKGILTQKKQMIEPKGIDRYKIDDRKRFVFFTNNRDYPVYIERDDRRYTLLLTNPKYNKNKEHFDAFCEECVNIELMKNVFEYFANYDLSQFDERNKVETDYGVLTKRLHMNPLENYIIFIIQSILDGKEYGINFYQDLESEENPTHTIVSPMKCWNLFKQRDGWYQKLHSKLTKAKKSTFDNKFQSIMKIKSESYYMGKGKSNLRGWKVSTDLNENLDIFKKYYKDKTFKFDDFDINPFSVGGEDDIIPNFVVNELDL